MTGIDESKGSMGDFHSCNGELDGEGEGMVIGGDRGVDVHCKDSGMKGGIKDKGWW